MRLSLIRAGMFALALGVLLARPGFAQSQGQITDVTTNGTTSSPTPPAPFVPNLSITTNTKPQRCRLIRCLFIHDRIARFQRDRLRPRDLLHRQRPGLQRHRLRRARPGVGFAWLEATLENAPSGSGIGGYEL